ncbi:uncharacterized protein NECHADRAFT_75049 [Fusarium vanettenii 77-13-4]|uniref:Uncharacterized protein n=1 Tax=Fusarium vanettenii (strain ATCC MYA-4622 / CBS 123669 / FGSC 9596 / NRRL 45880 / 77-13-4) TaxID=660122 RepID=C7YHQ1_FUSV7|nr:uncharacterized protein NECHADRAFT_75049 [Fusarium vanettenii 77-13-4]EEU47951.1 predicted protein [Fusarium vanettenii 77-13-4]
MEDSELVFWKVLFYVALGLVGALLLVCSCLLGGRHYKDEAIKDAEKFSRTLQHQAQLWEQERDRREREYELRLEEQRHKNAAFQQNSEIRDDMDDVMEENRVLREQKDALSQRNEQLAQESSRLRMENAGLTVQISQAKRPGQEVGPGFGLKSGLELRPGPERVVSVVNVENVEPGLPRNPSSTLFGSGLPPGSTYSLEAAVQNGSDSPGSHYSLPPTSEPGSPERTELPPSPSDDGQDPNKLNPASGSKQRNTWSGVEDSVSSRPVHEGKEWEPAAPGQRRLSN